MRCNNGELEFTRIGVFEFLHNKPQPPAPPKPPAPKPPKYKGYHSTDINYYPTQLVARFFELHKTIAKLDSKGNLIFETTPNLYLKRLDGKKEATGRILRIYPCAPNMYMFTILDESFSPYKLRQLTIATRQEQGIPKEIPGTHEHKLRVLEENGMVLNSEPCCLCLKVRIRQLRGSLLTFSKPWLSHCNY